MHRSPHPSTPEITFPKVGGRKGKWVPAAFQNVWQSKKAPSIFWEWSVSRKTFRTRRSQQKVTVTDHQWITSQHKLCCSLRPNNNRRTESEPYRELKSLLRTQQRVFEYKQSHQRGASLVRRWSPSTWHKMSLKRKKHVYATSNLPIWNKRSLKLLLFLDKQNNQTYRHHLVNQTQQKTQKFTVCYLLHQLGTIVHAKGEKDEIWGDQNCIGVMLLTLYIASFTRHAHVSYIVQETHTCNIAQETHTCTLFKRHTHVTLLKRHTHSTLFKRDVHMYIA